MAICFTSHALAGNLHRTLISCDAGLSNPETFKPNCFPVSTETRILDPEVSVDSRWVAWQTNPVLDSNNQIIRHGKFFITPIDNQTGHFMFDQSRRFPNVKPAPLSLGHVLYNNGPEWGASQHGQAAYITSFMRDTGVYHLLRFTQDGTGRWVMEPLPGSEGMGLGDVSINAIDPVSRILYLNVHGSFPDFEKDGGGWRHDLDAGAIDRPLPESKGRMPRWMANNIGLSSQLLQTVMAKEGRKRYRQLSIYDVDTGRETLISSNGKNISFFFPWSAPELAGESVFTAAAEKGDPVTGTELLVYRRDKNGDWQVVDTVPPINDTYRYLDSPETVVYQGRSYVFMVWMDRPERDSETSSLITVASINLDGHVSKPFHHVVSHELHSGPASLKLDPEAYLIKNGSRVQILYEDFASR